MPWTAERLFPLFLLGAALLWPFVPTSLGTRTWEFLVAKCWSVAAGRGALCPPATPLSFFYFPCPCRPHPTRPEGQGSASPPGVYVDKASGFSGWEESAAACLQGDQHSLPSSLARTRQAEKLTPVPSSRLIAGAPQAPGVRGGGRPGLWVVPISKTFKAGGLLGNERSRLTASLGDSGPRWSSLKGSDGDNCQAGHHNHLSCTVQTTSSVTDDMDILTVLEIAASGVRPLLEAITAGHARST